MHLDDRAVQRDGFDAKLDELDLLQPLEDAVEYAGFRPAAHARVDRVPAPEPWGQAPPFAAVLGHMENGVHDL